MAEFKAGNGLTPKQAAFVREYLVDMNSAHAAIRAGYAPKAAKVTGCNLLRKPAIAEAINAMQNERASRLDISADRVVEELAKVAFANIADYIEVGENGAARITFKQTSRDQFAAVSEIQTEEELEGGRDEPKTLVRKTKLKLNSKLDALEKIGKHLGMFTDKDAMRKIFKEMLESGEIAQ